MTKEELDQLDDLREEIKELERKVESLRQKKIEATYDKVKASYKDFPYIQGNATIYGYDTKMDEARYKEIERKLELIAARKSKVEKEEEKITRFINSVQESRVRRIMEYRYIEGYTWKKIGEIMHCDRTTAEKIVTRYLDKINKNDEN